MAESAEQEPLVAALDGTEHRRLVKNVGWTMLTTLLRVVFAGGTLALLGRLVDPATMGLYGMGWAAAALGFTISQSGAAQGVIAIRVCEAGHVAAAQFLSITISVLIGAALVLAGPAIEAFYARDGLDKAFLIGGLFVPVMSMAAVDVAVAQKELRFADLARIQTLAVVFASVTSIGLALAGLGLVALFALQGCVGLYTFLMFRITRHPTGLGRFKWRHLVDVWRIGGHLSLGSLTSVIWQNIPQLVLAKFVSTEALGLFVFCARIVQIIFSQLVTMVNVVIYPTFTTMQHDPARVGQAYLETARFTYFLLTIPLVTLMAAPAAFLLLYGGSQWVGAAEVLFYLSLMQSVVALGSNVFPTFQALGKPSIAWRWNLVIMAVQTLAVALVARYGVVSAAQALAASSLVMLLAPYWLGRIARFSYGTWLRSMASVVLTLPPAVALGLMVDRSFSTSYPILAYAVPGGAAALTYLLGVVLVERTLRDRLMGLIRARLKRAVIPS